MALLEIENLIVAFPSRTATGRAVDGVSITVAEGESLGVVGESGSGKSLTMLAVMGLVPYPGQLTVDRLAFKDRDLMRLSGRERRRLAGKSMAIACQPDLLIADEPTTALDVTVQAQILDLLHSLQRDRGMALILISHNMDVVAETARRVAVMYAGQIVEERDTAALFGAPQHPYTAALLAASPPPYTPPLAGEGREGAGRLATIPGAPPGLHDRPRGCLFGPRCAYATERSCATQPGIRPWMDGRIRCHYPLGDPDRNARIAADGLLGAKRVP